MGFKFSLIWDDNGYYNVVLQGEGKFFYFKVKVDFVYVDNIRYLILLSLLILEVFIRGVFYIYEINGQVNILLKFFLCLWK